MVSYICKIEGEITSKDVWLHSLSTERVWVLSKYMEVMIVMDKASIEAVVKDRSAGKEYTTELYNKFWI